MRSNTGKKEYVHPEATFVQFVYSSVVCMTSGPEVVEDEEHEEEPLFSLFYDPWQSPENSDEE